MKSSKNVQQELFTEKKNGETGTKRALDYLECLNYIKEIAHRYERLAVLQNVFAIIRL